MLQIDDTRQRGEDVPPGTPVRAAIRAAVAAQQLPPVPVRNPYTKVACVGTGVIGASWAALYATKGISVSMFSRNATKLQADVTRSHAHIDEMECSGLIPRGSAAAAHARLRLASSLEDCVADVDMVHETIAEDAAVKRAFFISVAAAAPAHAVIASSTSGLVISEVIEGLEQLAGRVIVAHPFNPPHIVKLVELVPMLVGDGSLSQVSTAARI